VRVSGLSGFEDAAVFDFPFFFSEFSDQFWNLASGFVVNLAGVAGGVAGGGQCDESLGFRGFDSAAECGRFLRAAAWAGPPFAMRFIEVEPAACKVA